MGEINQEITAPTKGKCVFCESETIVFTRIGKNGICGSCSNQLMRELLKTNEWKGASKIIAEAIKSVRR